MRARAVGKIISTYVATVVVFPLTESEVNAKIERVAVRVGWRPLLQLSFFLGFIPRGKFYLYQGKVGEFSKLMYVADVSFARHFLEYVVCSVPPSS